LWNSKFGSNVAVYAVVSVLVEFGATSTTKQEVHVLTFNERAVVPGGLGFAADWVAFIGSIIVMLFVVWFMIEEGQEIWAHRLGYFFDAWNLLDWANMLLMIVAFVARVINFVAANDANIGQEALADNVTFSSLRMIAERAETSKLLHAFNALLLWAKAIKYLRHMPVVKDLIRAVWDTFDLFLPFVCMFAVAFLGFVMAYTIGFGDKVWELSTFFKASVYLCRAFVKDIKLMPLYKITPMFGAMLIMLLYVTLVLVGASFLFAIIADALFHAKYRKDDGPQSLHEDEPLEEFAREFRRAFPGLFETKRQRAAAQRQKLQEQASAAGGAAGGEQPQPNVGKLAKLEDRRSSWRAAPASGLPSLQDVSGAPSQRNPSAPTRAELMRAIELMSGRVLSEISVVGIEIRSELHEVCERVAQMQMAVEELTLRSEKIRGEQEAELA